jgi:hypothetical protein
MCICTFVIICTCSHETKDEGFWEEKVAQTDPSLSVLQHLYRMLERELFLSCILRVLGG